MGGVLSMPRCLVVWCLVLVLSAAALGQARICLADIQGEIRLSADGEGWDLRLSGSMDFELEDGWKLSLKGIIPYPLLGEAECSAAFNLAKHDDPWAWYLSGALYHAAADDRGRLRVQAVYDDGPWTLSGALYREWETGSETADGGKLSVGLSLDKYWSVLWTQEIGQTTFSDTNGTELDYASSAILKWSGGGNRYQLGLTGSSHLDEDPFYDWRKWCAEFAWHDIFAGGWTLDGELGIKATESHDPERIRYLGLTLDKKGPLGAELRADYECGETGEDLLAGLALYQNGDFFWRAGLAVNCKLYSGMFEAWAYAEFGWVQGPWTLQIGLTPEGLYNGGKHGYWMTLTYEF